jgi:hypothetical protein
MTHKGWTKALTTIGISPGSCLNLVIVRHGHAGDGHQYQQHRFHTLVVLDFVAPAIFFFP